ncbi:carbohydrate-binding family 9-like protein [Flavimarina sp. Hel_I_48]|uniref:carbohydrate-binding family 9-like protein n=1 Tax=Flavimarina sp. Hel_I_48 TaxID=1392488 RepID=UPI0004DED097|nr:carbohydrate-binding family 9-like protein [Flavimarina sp. Hel_I_48]
MKAIKSLVYFLFSTTLFAQEIQEPRLYVAYKTTKTIKIDGKPAENAWETASWSTDFIDIEGEKTPKYKTNVKMIWDETNVYFYAKLEEPHIWATLKQRDTVIFYNNDFEIFMDPAGDTQNYMEFEMNAFNTVWDLLMPQAYREGGNAVDSWDIKNIQTAVHMEGSINDASDTDKYWSVEIAMPWEVLTEVAPGANIPRNDFWRINFSRVNWDFELKNGDYYRKTDEKGQFLPEYNWVWSPQGVINMHEPEHWGYVYFADVSPEVKLNVRIPQDEKIRWELYALYRAQKSYLDKNKKWAKSMKNLRKTPILIDGKPLKTTLVMHSAGWNITAESPFSNKKYLIDQEGDYKQLNK